MEDQNNNEYRNQRIENMERLSELGFSSYKENFKRSGRLKDLLNNFELNNPVSACGRILTIRKMGKMAFAHINDGSAKFQIMVKKDQIGEVSFNAFKLLDIGDIIGVDGNYFLTKTEEKTISVNSWVLLTKSLLPFPEKFHGLSDKEIRYRQRSLDLITNSETQRLFRNRTKIIKEIRNFLDENDFMEVETPMLQQIPGGATAKPFQSYYNALNTDVFMRIAPELYLKRLIVGGLDRVYELNRNFRNEGIDRTHNPEFTCLEIYQAYGDMRSMQQLIKRLFHHVAENVFQTKEFSWMGHTINIEHDWEEITYENLITKHLGNDWFSRDISFATNEAIKRDIKIDTSMNFQEITHEIYEKNIEPQLIQPTFVTRLPAYLVPLAKRCSDNEDFVDVFELIIAGKEIAPAYSELNDPIDQKNRFENQVEGNYDLIDYDFLTALEYGMPPTGGMGIGIDRLVMLMSGSEAIRDVILFPQLKPKNSQL